MRKVAWLVCWLSAACGLGRAQRLIEFEGRYWLTDSTQRVKLVDSGIGTEINFKSDLGFQDRNFPEARFNFYSGGRSRLRVSYVQVDYDGDRDIQRSLDFSGQRYTVGTRVISNLEIRHLKAGWAYRFVNIGDGKVLLGPQVGAHGLWLKAALRAPNLRPPVDQSDKLSVGFPTFGAGLDAHPSPFVSISGDFTGMPLGKYGYALDGELAVKAMPVRHLGLTVGYRLFRLNPKLEPDFAVVRISGPFVGASVRF